MNMKKSSLFIALLFFTITVKSYAYNVIPSGEAVGILIKTQGLMVTDTSKITDVNGHSVNAANAAGIKIGDVIEEANGVPVNKPEELIKIAQDSSKKISLKITRNNKHIIKEIVPVKTTNGNKLGIWVRNSAAGIGTITFIEPDTGKFFGLGHGITDVDTNRILPIREGNILKCSISTPTRGTKGCPGELNGVFYNTNLGTIEKNHELGIYGYLSQLPDKETMEICQSTEITLGDAYIIANVDGKGAKKYNISIKNISPKNDDNRNMIIEIIDEKLLKITGGIVQGMSGAPIIQNNKLIGAVTHVFLNDPKKGYGIFAEKMLSLSD